MISEQTLKDMSFLFGNSTAPQLSLVEQIGNSTLQYRTTRNALVTRVIGNAFAYASQQLIAFAATHIENNYIFDFGINVNTRNISGWETLSMTERNQVATGVANLFEAQNITANVTMETPAPPGASHANAIVAVSWVVPTTIITPSVPVVATPVENGNASN